MNHRDTSFSPPSLIPPSPHPHYAWRGTRRSLAGAGLIAVYHGCHSRRQRRGPDLDQRGLPAPPPPPNPYPHQHLVLRCTFTPHFSSRVFCCVFFPLFLIVDFATGTVTFNNIAFCGRQRRRQDNYQAENSLGRLEHQ